MNYSSMLLNKLSINDVIENPFAHIICRDVFDNKTYENLLNEFPFFIDGAHKTAIPRSNLDFSDPKAKEVFQRSDTWREFKNQILSPVFLSELIDLFYEPCRKLYPQIVQKKPLVVQRTKNSF